MVSEQRLLEMGLPLGRAEADLNHERVACSLPRPVSSRASSIDPLMLDNTLSSGHVCELDDSAIVKSTTTVQHDID